MHGNRMELNIRVPKKAGWGVIQWQRKETGRRIMPALGHRQLCVLLSGLLAVLLLDVAPVASQGSIQVGGKITLMRKNHIRFCVDKAENHYMGLYTFEGTNHSKGTSSFMHHAAVSECIFTDVVERTGPIQGYATMSREEGSAILKWSGYWTTVYSADGSSLMQFEGSFNIVKGTGQYANIEGTGTFEGKMTGPFVQVMEWQGEYSIRE
jgi:hypothetical protein